MTTATSYSQTDVHLDAGWMDRHLRADVSAGLATTPKSLPPKWFYDAVGSDLFEQITALDEYYLTRREAEILEREAATIASLSGATTIVELGSGSSTKTRLLLDAFTNRGGLDLFVPFDVSAAAIDAAKHVLHDAYPTLNIHAVVGDFEHHLETLPSQGTRCFVFLGSTIGNFEPTSRAEFLAGLASAMRPGDSLLLGADLVKSIDRLELAYNDPAGITAAFNKNVLSVLNRELGADFDLDCFEHVARFDTENEWIDIGLRSTHEQRVHIGDLDLEVDFGAGELMRTEISAKFRTERLAAELARAGLHLRQLWTDAAGDFSVTLSVA